MGILFISLEFLLLEVRWLEVDTLLLLLQFKLLPQLLEVLHELGLLLLIIELLLLLTLILELQLLSAALALEEEDDKLTQFDGAELAAFGPGSARSWRIWRVLDVSGSLGADGLRLMVPCWENSDSKPCSVESEARLRQPPEDAEPLEPSVSKCEEHWAPSEDWAPSGTSELRRQSDRFRVLTGVSSSSESSLRASEDATEDARHESKERDSEAPDEARHESSERDSEFGVVAWDPVTEAREKDLEDARRSMSS